METYVDQSAETYPPRSSLKFFDDGSIQTGVSLSSTPLDDFHDDQEISHSIQPATRTVTQQNSIHLVEDDDLDDADEIDFQPRSSLNSLAAPNSNAQLNKSLMNTTTDSEITISPRAINQHTSLSGINTLQNQAIGLGQFKNNINTWNNNLSSSYLPLHQLSPSSSNHNGLPTNYNQFSLLQPEDFSSSFQFPPNNLVATSSPLMANPLSQNINSLPNRQSPNIMIQQLTNRVKQQEMDISNQLSMLLEDSNKLPINMNVQFANNTVPNPVHFASPFMMPYGATNYSTPAYPNYGSHYPQQNGNNLPQQRQ